MKTKLGKVIVFYLISILLLSLLIACTSPAKKAAPSPTEIIDQTGRVVRLEKVPERIVSLAPSNTEILFALGLGDKVVGVSDYCNYPPEAQEKEKVGGYSEIDIEKVVALEPDLILADEIHKAEVIPALEKLGLTVFALDPRSLDEVLESITLIGEVTGSQREASRLVDEMTDRINAVTNKTARLSETQIPRVFYIIWHDPLMTVGIDTWHHEIIGMVGGKNIIQDTEGFPTISLEALIEANPQVIIAGSGMGEGADLPFQFVSTEARLEGVDARLNSRVYEINADLMDRPGPRLIDGLEQLAKLIQPELFKDLK